VSTRTRRFVGLLLLLVPTLYFFVRDAQDEGWGQATLHLIVSVVLTTCIFFGLLFVLGIKVGRKKTK
jgi:hypothetical protein